MWARIGWIAFALVLTGLLVTAAREVDFRRLSAAGFVTLCFAVLAWMIRSVTLDGAGAGFLVTATLFVAGGPAMFEAVLLVFVLTYAATKLGRKRKQSLEIAERPAGARCCPNLRQSRGRGADGRSGSAHTMA